MEAFSSQVWPRRGVNPSIEAHSFAWHGMAWHGMATLLLGTRGVSHSKRFGSPIPAGSAAVRHLTCGRNGVRLLSTVGCAAAATRALPGRGRTVGPPLPPSQLPSSVARDPQLPTVSTHWSSSVAFREDRPSDAAQWHIARFAPAPAGAHGSARRRACAFSAMPRHHMVPAS